MVGGIEDVLFFVTVNDDFGSRYKEIAYMQVGVVTSFNEEGGYGFIETKDGDSVFVHYRSIEMEGFRVLEPGDRVYFDLVSGKRGPEAKNVRKIE